MGKLAIFGGEPIRNKIYTAYPAWTEEQKSELCKVVDNRILSAFYGWKKSHEFEEAFAAYHEMDYAIAVNSGTAALHCAYAAVGLTAGDEIIMPANAYISAATAALMLNAIPVFADIDPNTLTLDPNKLESYITPKTKAIIAVHLYGNVTNMKEVMKIAKKHNLILLEDCAQAYSAKIDGQRTGTFGDISIFSMCCRKHMNAGEGGMVMTNNKEWAEAVRRFANKGKGEGWWDYFHIGYSYTMTELQAVFGITTLKRLPDEIARRREIAEIYRELFKDTDLEFINEPEGHEYVYFKFPFKIPKEYAKAAQWFDKAIRAENVMVERSYPYLHSIPWIKNKEYSAWDLVENGRERVYRDGDCPTAEDVCTRLFAASSGPGISNGEVKDTAEAILKVYNYMKNNWYEVEKCL